MYTNQIKIAEIIDTERNDISSVVFSFPVNKEHCEHVRHLAEQYRKDTSAVLIGLDNGTADYYNNDNLFNYYIEFSRIFDISGSTNSEQDFNAFIHMMSGCRAGLSDFCPKHDNQTVFFTESADSFDQAAEKIYIALNRQHNWMKSHNPALTFSNMYMSIETTLSIPDENEVHAFLDSIYVYGQPEYANYYFWNHIPCRPDTGLYRVSLLCACN